jgi:hypothetical protein
MEELECPRCHQKSIPAWRKQCLGPMSSATCPSCHGRLSIPLSAIWITTPFLAAAVASIYIESFAISAVLVVAGFLAMCWLNHKYVPLIPK